MLKVLIGRSSQCDYTIENPNQHGTVSGKHATISETETPNIYLFEDHSTNGSYINGQLLHNASCKVNVSDHITLGKTYILPFDDIVKRYFMAHRTTKKKPQQKPETPIDTPKTPEDKTPAGEATVQAPEPNVVTVEKIVEKEVEKIVEKVPAWFWVLFVASVAIAFFIGMNF